MNAELTGWQKVNFGILLPTLAHFAASLFLWMVVLPMSSGEAKGWNLIALTGYLPIAVVLSAILNGWVFWSEPRCRLSCFLHGLWIPTFAYSAMIVFTIHIYRETDRHVRSASPPSNIRHA